MYKTENFKADLFKPARFEAKGSITLNGQEIPYHTVAEDNVFYDVSGKPIATIFSYSYFRGDVENTADRPVIFGFNGGPGSSSMYVHAGFLGTRRIVYGEVDRPTALPPYEVIDNPDCLLDIADLVLVDPVATGYGALLDEERGKDFFGIEPDAEALLTFIEQWLHRYNRWLSPKYLVGESYGCTRSAVAAGIAATQGKERSYGIAFDGLVLIGNTVTVGKYFGRELPVESSVLFFTTFAALNWYHNHPSDQSLEEFVYEAKAFAENEYLHALYKGERLQGEEREDIIRRLMYYTGASRAYLEDRDLKIDSPSFRSEVAREKGYAVARFDGRITRPFYTPRRVEDTVGLWDDASSDRYGPYFFGALTGDILPRLGIKLERQYVSSYGIYKSWNTEETMGTTGEHLRNAMRRTPGMRVFFANGWFDGATDCGHVFYTCDHAGLPMDRVSFKGYPSGHMIYIGEENVHTLCRDIRSFIMGGTPDPTE